MIAIQTESARQSRQRERGAAVEPALVERWPGDPVAAGRGPQSPQHSANMSQGACRARAVLPYTCRPLRSQGRGASRCAPRAAVRLSLRRRLCHGRCGRGHSRGRCGRRECPVSPRLLLWTAGVMVSTLVLRMTARGIVSREKQGADLPSAPCDTRRHARQERASTTRWACLARWPSSCGFCASPSRRSQRRVTSWPLSLPRSAFQS